MPRGALFSVGGTPAPVIEALKGSPVDSALFIVSERSEEQVSATIVPAIGYSLQWECVRVSDPDDLNACYQQIRNALRGWIDRRRLRNEDIYFDLTGGTKPMSAALTLAAVEQIPRYHYISGEREKNGVGTVVTGTEKPVTGLNPWTQIAIRQRELANSLFAQGHPELPEWCWTRQRLPRRDTPKRSRHTLGFAARSRDSISSISEVLRANLGDGSRAWKSYTSSAARPGC